MEEKPSIPQSNRIPSKQKEEEGWRVSSGHIRHPNKKFNGQALDL